MPKRDDGGFHANEQGFRVLKKLLAAFGIGLHVAPPQKLIVALILPASAIVAIVAHPKVEKVVWIVVVADPTAGREIVVQLALGSEIDLPFHIAQVDAHALFTAPPLLQF